MFYSNKDEYIDLIEVIFYTIQTQQVGHCHKKKLSRATAHSNFQGVVLTPKMELKI